MKEQVWQQLIDDLRKVENLVSERMPEFIVETLRYEKIMNTLSALVALVVLVVLSRIAYSYLKARKEIQKDFERELLLWVCGFHSVPLLYLSVFL